ncbi:hypothetical protein IMF27_03165 [Pseudomonas sp. PCH199]|uniref:hypothetical protein n=1 Tax=unclassified Pseudomonas TaxID=196821 RepID=UPI000BD13C37|nr:MULTISPECIES: hypothetical protein [unclassified Pseudomonas]MCW8274830.1 hypothetical protein [Pseudomonas sp. PCH199]PAM85492.1 hypothetical protein CES87_03245 [Pseudomonas sp. ERMR1:02]
MIGRSNMFVNGMRLGNNMIPRDKIGVGASGIEIGVVPQEGTPFGAMRERLQPHSVGARLAREETR